MEITLACYNFAGELVDSDTFDSERDQMPEELRAPATKELGMAMMLTQCRIPVGVTTDRGILILSADSHSVDMVRFVLGHELGHVKLGSEPHFNDVGVEIIADKTGVELAGPDTAIRFLTLMKESIADTLQKCGDQFPGEVIAWCNWVISSVTQRINQIK